MKRSEQKRKEKGAHEFLLFNYFWKNVLLIILVRNTLSKIIKVFQ